MSTSELEGESSARETARAGWVLTTVDVAIVLILSGFLAFSLPKFRKFYEDFGAPLPVVTQHIISVERSVWIVAGVFTCAFLFLKNRLMRRRAAVLIDSVALAALALAAAVVMVAVYVPWITTIGNLQ